MLNLKRTNGKAAIRLSTAHMPVEQLLEKEWLLTNGRGGYSASTIIGCNTSSYHGLLVGSFENPANRILALSNCLETIYWGSGKFELSTFEFPGAILPAGYLRMKHFSRDAGVHFHYQIGETRLIKSVYLLRGRNTAALVYEFADVEQPVEFTVRPFVGLRDFHHIQKSTANIQSGPVTDGVHIRHASNELGHLLLVCPSALFEYEPQWWYNFVYRASKERGQEHSEDLFSPGFFKCLIDTPRTLVLWVDLEKGYNPGHFIPPDVECAVGEIIEYQDDILAVANDDEILGTLYQAADQFIVKSHNQGDARTTIFAGYPWFADWGRDAFISLPGLLLAPRRLEEAKSILLTFARAGGQGVIPNRFDDYSNAAHFNSVDASLWFINAAFAWLAACGEKQTFQCRLLPTIISIIDSYQHGTAQGIHADEDGLIIAGDANTQLTWMDAKYDGVAFTPRYGKPVEVNALWYNAIMLLVDFLKANGGDFARLLDIMKSRSDTVKENFNRLFWNSKLGWLNDCIGPDGIADSTLRPNQIFAVSLPFSPLDHNRQKAVVDVIERKLLTQKGLRTLPQEDGRYHGVYTGPQSQRDKAYHQGTVWPYLIGPFVEAYLKVHGQTEKNRKKAKTFIEPLLQHLVEDACIGSVSEICDGDHPHRPKGCFAQAWSVAELIRAYLMGKE